MKKVILVLIILAIVGIDAVSRPQYSILQTYGTKCSNCHINNNYGGQRSGAGFLARKDFAVINPEWIGLQGVFDKAGEGNSFLDGKVLWGLDFRYQNARWYQTKKLEAERPKNDDSIYTPTLERKGMIMQLMPYLSIQPVEWMKVDGMYNLSTEIEPNMRYKGQPAWHASATFFIQEDAPSVRIGYFPPSMGVDYDDHTILVRTVAANSTSSPLITTDYAEYGIEFNYEKLSWLSASLGVFDSKNMAQLKIGNVTSVDSNTMSTVARVSFHPDLPYNFVGYFGASHYYNSQLKTDNGIYFGNKYLTITSLFLAIGMSEKFSVVAEYVHSNKQTMRAVDNTLLEVTYQIMEPLNIFARYETSNTDLKVNFIDPLMLQQNFSAVQYVFGSHINLLPFIDLLPEYRIYKRNEFDGYSSQWTFQLHIFY
jgi:hypothetical protein